MIMYLMTFHPYSIISILYDSISDEYVSPLQQNVNMLPVIDRVKDLGVIIDSHLTFTYHIDQIVAIALI